jgi:hypothetical protein
MDVTNRNRFPCMERIPMTPYANAAIMKANDELMFWIKLAFVELGCFPRCTRKVSFFSPGAPCCVFKIINRKKYKFTV